MAIRFSYFYIWGLVLITLFTSCTQVVLIIDELPANTPKGAPLYVAGNFNQWDPGDNRFKLQMQADSSYTVKLPQFIGRLEYKFTRGDWSTVETDRCGNENENRYFMAGMQDTVFNAIESWADLEPLNCDSITLVVSSIPENTPLSDTLKIAGSFNAWNPGNDARYFLQKDSSLNSYTVTVPRISWRGNSSGILTYKFIRNNLNLSEADKFGRELEPRVLDFKQGDSVFVSIDNWVDLADPALNHVVIILESIPKNTPAGDRLYLAGNFNDWNPGNPRFVFTKNKNNKYQIVLPRKRFGLSFKITRGSWENEFAGSCGQGLGNQDYNYDEVDTLRIAVEGWIDLPRKINPLITLIVDKVPANTPPGDDLYLDYFEFFAGRKKQGFAFESQKNGRYELTLERNKLDGFFVLTRGSHLSQEIDTKGNFVIPKAFINTCYDTVFIQVDAWNDLFSGPEQMITLLVNKVPKKMPVESSIYLSGRFNGWDPGDPNFKLQKSRTGDYSIQVPVRWLKTGFKFTRGDWESAESNAFGIFIQNRTYTGNAPELTIKIAGWEDM